MDMESILLLRHNLLLLHLGHSTNGRRRPCNGNNGNRRRWRRRGSILGGRVLLGWGLRMWRILDEEYRLRRLCLQIVLRQGSLQRAVSAEVVSVTSSLQHHHHHNNTNQSISPSKASNAVSKPSNSAKNPQRYPSRQRYTES